MPPTSRPGRRPDPATRRRWQQRLDRFPRSGLTVPTFCEREGVSAASFHSWRRRLQHDPAPPAPDTARLVPVRLVTPPASAPVELLLPEQIKRRQGVFRVLSWR
jgi:transposase